MNECYNEMKIRELDKEIESHANDLLLILFSNLSFAILGEYYLNLTYKFVEKGILHQLNGRVFTSHFIFKKLCEYTSILPSDLLLDLKTSITWQLF